MEITIQKAETLDNKPLTLIWFGDIQVALKENEFENLKENIKLFEVDEKETALEVPVQEQLSKVQAKQTLIKQFNLLANLNEKYESENLSENIKVMLEIYTILFPYHP